MQRNSNLYFRTTKSCLASKQAPDPSQYAVPYLSGFGYIEQVVGIISLVILINKKNYLFTLMF